MIDKKIFFESIKAFLINFGFEMKEEDLQIYCRLCYEFFIDSRINDNDFIDVIQKVIKTYTKEEIKTRPSAYDFYNLIKQNIEPNLYQIAETEFNKALIKKKFGIFETVDVITEYIIDKIDINTESKDKFIDMYIKVKNNQKLKNIQVLLIENKNKDKNSDKSKKITDVIKDLSEKLAGNY